MLNKKIIQNRLELITRKWWFFLALILLQFIPPYASKGITSWQDSGYLTGAVLTNALINNISILYPVFKIIPIILVISIILYKNKARRIFSIYAGINYALFAVLQNVGITEQYGLGIVTINVIMFLIVAISWFWESIIQKNDFTIRKIPKWKYLLIILSFIAFWYPTEPKTFTPNFNPLGIITNMAGLAFCTMTPFYITILIIYYPKINTATLRITSLIGFILAFYNIWVNFFISPTTLWWNGILHIPLLITSVTGIICSYKK
ncbi:Uncharacterised protein [Candidatus Tiddalikarchaeum anstoanum]|nr:Uncharacterised protein [Candidatus Tiddalikarchaeum anstoanum]